MEEERRVMEEGKAAPPAGGGLQVMRAHLNGLRVQRAQLQAEVEAETGADAVAAVVAAAVAAVAEVEGGGSRVWVVSDFSDISGEEQEVVGMGAVAAAIPGTGGTAGTMGATAATVATVATGATGVTGATGAIDILEEPDALCCPITATMVSLAVYLQCCDSVCFIIRSLSS